MGDCVIKYEGSDKAIDLDRLVLDEEFPAQLKEKDRKGWIDFHSKYISEVGQTVGFKWKELSPDPRRVFDRIFKEYHDDNPNLRDIFGSYGAFFHCFFTLPYGIEYDKGSYTDKLPEIDAELQGYIDEFRKLSPEEKKTSPLDKTINKTRERIRTIEFTRAINLPRLLYNCLESDKKIKYEFNGKTEISYETEFGEIENPVVIEPFFYNHLFNNLFSSVDDCIFITNRMNQDCTRHVTFQKYWFASLLHHIHPKISYINFRTYTEDVPQDLFRVKLIEATDDKGRRYLVVGGVLGENFERIKSQGIKEFVDSCIKEYFQDRYSKNDRLLYNLNHVDGFDKPYNQFVEYIMKKYNLDDLKLRIIGETNKIECTHRLHVPWDSKEIERLSNLKEDGTNKYSGEQYSETFQPNMEEETPGAFTKLEGLVRGFDITRHEKKKSRMKNALIAGAVTLLCSLGIAYNYLKPDTEHRNVDVPADFSFPKGKGIAKRLDVNGDGMADLVGWENGKWLIRTYKAKESSITNILFQQNEYGKLIILTHDKTSEQGVWPCMADIDADGRDDFVLYDKNKGYFYIKFARDNVIREGGWKKWDWIIKTGVGAACKDRLEMDYRKSVYGRPLLGDYNGDGWIDLAVVCSDGIWRIDYGGPSHKDYGQVDEEIRYLDNQRLAQAPGWAYIPIFDEIPGGRRLLAYKVPDNLPDAGKIIRVKVMGGEWPASTPAWFGGNDTLILSGRHASPNELYLLTNTGNWLTFSPENGIHMTDPPGIYSGTHCHPVFADFDGDGIDDRAVYCDDGWKIKYSGNDMPRDKDGIARVGFPRSHSQLSLPGVGHFGGSTYLFTLQLLHYVTERNTDYAFALKKLIPNDPKRKKLIIAPPPIPIDMLETRMMGGNVINQRVITY